MQRNKKCRWKSHNGAKDAVVITRPTPPTPPQIPKNAVYTTGEYKPWSNYTNYTPNN